MKASSRVISTESPTEAELLRSELESTATSKTFQCGQLYVGLTVRRERGTQPASVTLVVRVLRAENLPPREFSGTCDPYVKVSYTVCLYCFPPRSRARFRPTERAVQPVHRTGAQRSPQTRREKK